MCWWVPMVGPSTDGPACAHTRPTRMVHLHAFYRAVVLRSEGPINPAPVRRNLADRERTGGMIGPDQGYRRRMPLTRRLGEATVVITGASSGIGAATAYLL